MINVKRAVTVNMSFSYEEYADKHLRTGFATVMPLLLSKKNRLRYLRRQTPDRRVFTRVHQHLQEKKKVPFQVQTAVLNVKYSEMWRKMKTLLTWYGEVHALVYEEFLPASVLRT